MGKPNRSYAEEGLEEINETNGAAEANISGTATGGTDDEFQQVGGLEPVSYFYRTSAPKTKPKHPYKILEKGQTITGVYERNFITGKFKNPTYLIRLTDGTLIGLPGAGSLKRAMDKLSEGSKVKIQYDGMATIKGGEWAGNNAHNFTVFGSKLKA